MGTISKTKSDSVLEFKDGDRPPLITIKDGKVNVATLKLSMSRKHRFVMFVDLWSLVIISALTGCIAYLDGIVAYRWLAILIGTASVLSFIGKTVSDFADWLYTMNVMQEKMGEWYLDDVVGICQDFIGAGARLAAEVASEKGKDESKKNEDVENP